MFFYIFVPRTTVSQDVQIRFPVQLALAKFLSKIKGNFWGSAVSMILANYLILLQNLAKANCTENRFCTSCDIVVLDLCPYGGVLYIFSIRAIILEYTVVYFNVLIITIKNTILYIIKLLLAVYEKEDFLTHYRLKLFSRQIFVYSLREALIVYRLIDVALIEFFSMIPSYFKIKIST